ncbi:hypothetical protein [Streptomyces sp. NPDC052107]|uniref:hypothetical protein n=1 Tax=Streptomyces sp. NPDC052107 TaxID=3155632 RepID=UPI00341D9B22
MSAGTRVIAADLDDEAADSYRHHGYLKIGSYEVTADGLTVDCRPGDVTPSARSDGSSTRPGPTSVRPTRWAPISRMWRIGWNTAPPPGR